MYLSGDSAQTTALQRTAWRTPAARCADMCSLCILLFAAIWRIKYKYKFGLVERGLQIVQGR